MWHVNRLSVVVAPLALLCHYWTWMLPSTPLHVGKLECTLAGPRWAYLLFSMSKQCLSKESDRVIGVILPTPSNWLRIGHGQNDFVLTSRFLFGALTLDLPVGLIYPRIIKSRGLTILICLIFLPFVSGIFQIILTHGWNCKIFFRDKLVQFWNSSFSSFIIGHLKFWHLFLAFKFWHLSLTSELRHLFIF